MTQILLMSSILFSRLAAMLARWTGAFRTFADPVCNMLPFSGFIIWSSLSQIFLEKIHFYHAPMHVLPKKAKNLFTSNQPHFSINVKQSCFRLSSKFQEYNYPITVITETNSFIDLFSHHGSNHLPIRLDIKHDSKYQNIFEYSRIFWSYWNTLLLPSCSSLNFISLSCDSHTYHHIHNPSQSWMHLPFH